MQTYSLNVLTLIHVIRCAFNFFVNVTPPVCNFTVSVCFRVICWSGLGLLLFAYMQRIIHGCAEVGWNFCWSVQLDISLVRCAHL